MSEVHQCVGTISLDVKAKRDDHSDIGVQLEENGMTCLAMNKAQQCMDREAAVETPRRARPIAWPRQLLSRLQRALVGVVVVGVLALSSAALMTMPSPAGTPVAAEIVPVVQLPRVVIRAKRLPAGAAVLACPVPGHASSADCPVPVDSMPTKE